MDLKHIQIELIRLSKLIDLGQFDEAFDGIECLYPTINVISEKDGNFFSILSNLASLYIDIGSMKPCRLSAQKGIDILNQYPSEISERIGEDSYFYILGNAKSNFVRGLNQFSHTFSTIEQLIEGKTYFWKAIKSFEKNHGKPAPPQYTVNLGNSLKQQFRLSEALYCYDKVNALQLDIPQAWINRSETLIMLNQVSNSYSIQMLKQIKQGYVNILSSTEIPPTWLDHYRQQIVFHQEKITEACICVRHHKMSIDSNNC